MHQILVLLLICCSFVIYYVLTLEEKILPKTVVKRSPAQVETQESAHSLNVNTSTWQSQQNQSNFLINTTGCRIFSTDLFNTKVNKCLDFLHPKVRKPYCQLVNEKFKPPLVGSDGHSIFVIENALEFYRSQNNAKIECWFSPFWQMGADKISGYKIGNATEFSNRIAVPNDTEFVVVKCAELGKIIYTDVHSFVPLPNISNKTQDQDSLVQVPNVLVFGMDALSRLNFHRQMPRTSARLQKLGFIEYYGYNKLADNTYPNLVPFLTGKTTSELSTSCLQTYRNTYDECPFIWNKYKQLNYLTAYAEEESGVGTFHHERNGFARPPTDYYYYPFDRFASTEIGHTYLEATNFCLGPRRSGDVFLSYVTKFINSLKNRRFFGFFWEVSFSHDDLNLPRTADNEHISLFEEIRRTGLLETSVVAFISDHGIRFGKILETHEGYMEERLPLFMLSFPQWFRSKYKLAYANFRRNARSLTTHFDAHEMLNDLVNLSRIEDTEIIRRTNELNASALPRGISLFLPVPDKRTCTDAAIPNNYCTCDVPVPTEVVDVDASVRDDAKFLVEHINKLVSQYKDCSELTLKNIVSARRIPSRKGATITTVIVQTEPGGGEFEGLIEKTSGFKDVAGTVSRINVYKNQSHCVSEPTLKLYCYCRVQ